jgi:carbon monoxide dehydrogenase subunit G
MKLEGRVTVATSLADAWTRINDPDVLESCAPGLQTLEFSGEDHLEAELDLKLSAIQSRFAGALDFLERRPPDYVHCRVQGRGPAGNVAGDLELFLAETDEGTEFRYAGNVEVGGQVGRLGERMVSGLAREMAGQFFEAFERWEPDAPDRGVARRPGRNFLRLIWRSLLRLLGLAESS